uniref:Uncharacterized protein n=1 Tax=Medicago truncatula TaxID=3880 RepID=Q1RU77_MEDTR|nr:hypothetical protein MtrDRAFT_AC153123g6v2 [Medicago truncatula]
MKIQEALENITKGGISLPNSKTSYIEANIEKDKGTTVSAPRQHSYACGTQFRAPRPMLTRLMHGSRRLEPVTPLTCA